MSWRQAHLFIALLAPPTRAASAQVPPYRARILGVFDDASGAPVDSVRVTDVLNGISSLTTRTTVSLFRVQSATWGRLVSGMYGYGGSYGLQ